MISVLMSIYNEPDEWIKLSIESILNQTFNDFEFIIINDNPNRALNEEVLQSYISKDSRIITVTNEKNIGLTKSLNKGLRIAKGEYIARMDADDISLPSRFKKQYEFLENNKDIIACGTDISFIDEEGYLLRKKTKPIFSSESINNTFPLHNPVYHPTLFIRKSILTKNNITYNEVFKYAQDYELIKELIFVGKVANIDIKLLNYRMSKVQISIAKLDKQNYYANRTRLNLFKNLFKIKEENNPENIYSSLVLLRKKDENNKKLNNSILSLVLNFPCKKGIIINEICRKRIPLMLRLKLLLRLLR